ncbi:acetyltransferase [Vibrio cholerae]|nr:acetyltransferase [Vibrio cholerae]ELJ8688342.1 acetyltransferase [Vibrio cholerae]HDZ9325949.1 acetyltransferase [Vibrio cholerae]
MVSVVVLESSVKRCQPLRRALCTFLKSFLQIKLVHSIIMR